MVTATQREMNEAAYRQLKDTLAKTYPTGQYVAISEGRIVADADNFPQLIALLKAMGKNPIDALVVEAGVNYPEYGIILAGSAR